MTSLNIFYRLGLTLYVIKTALAAGLSWLVASTVYHSHYPYFAALGAILTVQVTVFDSINKGIYRVSGVVVGVIVSIIVGHWLPVNYLTVALVVFVGMAFSTAIRLHPQIISQVAVSTLLVLAFGGMQGYAVDRIVETIFGCVIAVLINTVVIPPNPIPDAEKKVLYLSDYASTVLKNLAFAYQVQSLSPVDMPYVQELLHETEKTYQAVQVSLQSLRYSPLLRNRRSRVIALSNIILRFERITSQIRGIARALVDLEQENHPNHYFIEAMKSTAICIELVAKQEINSSNDLREALKLALEEAKKHQSLCLLHIKDIQSLKSLREFGSMLTDLHRILDEVEGGARHVTERKLSVR
ncbi:aromatic acid exporter family protein [Bacillus sp. AFS096315]|uniref:FUSC family protein n=1 Tax=Bacillus sp. AFS096315 TaxID=2033517 RepID=UPI000BEC9CA6|nr:hypothetical protein CON00_12235 [Bacillus sp. AFS096315]